MSWAAASRLESDYLQPQAPLSMEFFRQECQSGLPYFAPGHLPDPGIEPGSPALQAYSLLSEPQCKYSVNFTNHIRK